jgi:hypothetical protein
MSFVSMIPGLYTRAASRTAAVWVCAEICAVALVLQTVLVVAVVVGVVVVVVVVASCHGQCRLVLVLVQGRVLATTRILVVGGGRSAATVGSRAAKREVTGEVASY